MLTLFVAATLALARLSSAACSVSTPGGTVDLSSLTLAAGATDYTFSGTSASFSFLLNICGPLTFSDQTCPAGTGLCQVYNGASGQSGLVGYGPYSTNPEYDAATGDVHLVFTSTEYCVASTQQPFLGRVIFQCGTVIGAPVLMSETSCDATILWRSTAACPGGGGSSAGNSSLSAGSWMMVLFCLVLVTYVFCGVSYRYQFTEARTASELVPNKALWVALPGLVKDGVLFVFTCGRHQPTYSSLGE